MLPDIFHRLRALFARSTVERELDDELRFHFERQVEVYEHAGLDSDEARRRARIEMGGLDQVKEDYRDVLGVRIVDEWSRDVRLALRSLKAAPMVTGMALLSLFLAVGATTAIFSIVDSLMLRRLPVRDPDRLVLITDTEPTRLRTWNYPVWQQIYQRSDLFETTAAWSGFRFNVETGGDRRTVDGLYATGTFFETLGVRAARGRTFTMADDRTSFANGVPAVIGHAFWQRQFGGREDVLGRLLRIEGQPFTIVGVMPSGFFGAEVGRTFDVIVPFESEPLIRGGDSFLDSAGANWLRVIARLRPGQTVDEATSSLRGMQAQIRAATIGELSSREAAERYLKTPFVVTPAGTGHSNLRRAYEDALLTLMIVAGLVLLIACANIANLLLARASARRQQLSLQLALGASQWQLARLLLIESSLLAVAGAAGGLLVAVWGSRLLVRQLATPGSTLFLDLSLDANMLAFTAATVMVTTLLFGAAPALRASRLAPIEALKDGGRGGTPRGRLGVAGSLVTAQVTLSVVLLAFAGLFIHSFTALATRPLGYDADQLLVVTVDSRRAAGDQPARMNGYARVLDSVREMPQVGTAAISMVTPFGGGGFTPPVTMQGVERFDSQWEIWGNVVSPGWFEAFGTRLVAGRDFTPRDRRGAPRVAIVNETMARRFFGGAPLGRTITLWPGETREMPAMEIVGVAADTVWSLRSPSPAMWYAPIDQFDPTNWRGFGTAQLVVRPREGSPSQLARPVADRIAATHAELALTVRSLQDQVRGSVAEERLTALLAGSFGALALLLAGLGLYGVTAYGVSLRRAEIGIRMAMGARPAGVVRLVLGRSCLDVGAGLVLGVGVSLWATRFIASLIHGIDPRSPITYSAAVVTVTAVALLAAWLPARRAARIDPIVVLRES
jgi:predicted permease